MITVPVQNMINSIKAALFQEYGPDFYKLSEKDQNALIIKVFMDLRTED